MSEEIREKEKDGEENEISGLNAFFSMPENASFFKELFDNVEKVIYNGVNYNLGVHIKDVDIYELGKYIGELQILVELGKDIIKFSNDENKEKKIGKLLFKILNELGDIYIFILKDVDFSDYLYKTFQENVKILNELIMKYISF